MKYKGKIKLIEVPVTLFKEHKNKLSLPVNTIVKLKKEVYGVTNEGDIDYKNVVQNKGQLFLSKEGCVYPASKYSAIKRTIVCKGLKHKLFFLLTDLQAIVDGTFTDGAEVEFELGKQRTILNLKVGKESWFKCPTHTKFKNKTWRILSIDMQGGYFTLHRPDFGCLEDIDIEECSAVK